MTSQTKLRRTLALVLAGGSLAIGVPAALAAGGGDSGADAAGGAPDAGFVQDDRSGQARPDDCPERGGDQGGSGSREQGADDATTTTPAV